MKVQTFFGSRAKHAVHRHAAGTLWSRGAVQTMVENDIGLGVVMDRGDLWAC